MVTEFLKEWLMIFWKHYSTLEKPISTLGTSLHYAYNYTHTIQGV
jgi:hypothetical protein